MRIRFSSEDVSGSGFVFEGQIRIREKGFTSSIFTIKNITFGGLIAAGKKLKNKDLRVKNENGERNAFFEL